MFRVSFSLLFVCYLSVILAGLFAVWVFGDWRRKRREKLARRYHLICNICGLPYEDKSHDEIPPCPKCGALNEREPFRDI